MSVQSFFGLVTEAGLESAKAEMVGKIAEAIDPVGAVLVPVKIAGVKTVFWIVAATTLGVGNAGYSAYNAYRRWKNDDDVDLTGLKVEVRNLATRQNKMEVKLEATVKDFGTKIDTFNNGLNTKLDTLKTELGQTFAEGLKKLEDRFPNNSTKSK
jgi:uncharacterized protein YlxW (UPF0749 family)